MKIKLETIQTSVQRVINGIAVIEKRWRHLSESQRADVVTAINQAVARLNDTNNRSNEFKFKDEIL